MEEKSLPEVPDFCLPAERWPSKEWGVPSWELVGQNGWGVRSEVKKTGGQVSRGLWEKERSLEQARNGAWPQGYLAGGETGAMWSVELGISSS